MTETPEQRRVIDAQLAEGLDDIQKRRVSKSFDTVEEMLASRKSSRKTSSLLKVGSEQPIRSGK